MSTPPGPGTRTLRKGRYSQPNGIYFITATTYQRTPWFQAHDLARIMCRNLQNPSTSLDSEILCWVVMPDHIHMLAQLRKKSLAQVLKVLKARSAQLLNREIGRKGRFWAPGYYDHALRQEESARNIARYIVANPVRAGIVLKASDYPYWNTVWL